MAMFDWMSSENPYGGRLSDEAWAYYRRQRLGQVLTGVGDYLSRAAVGDYSGGRRSAGGSQDALVRAMQMDRMIEAQQDRSAKRQRQKTKDEANAAIIAKIRGLSGPVGPKVPVRGFPGAAPVTAQALPPPRPMSGLRSDPGFIASLMAANPKSAIGLMFPGPRKAPKTRRRIQGATTIQEQFDPATGKFTEIGRGPRFKPSGPGGPTAAQQASNREITQARKRLTELEGKLKAGSTLAEELHLRMSQKTPTGRSAPDYNSYWGRTGWLAAQSLTGEDDPGQAYWSQRLMGIDARPQPSASEAGGFAGSPEVGPALLPPTDSARSGDLPPSAFAPPSEPPARTPPPTERELRRRSAGKPDIGETVTVQGRAYEILKENLDGTVVILDLKTGQQMIAEYER